MVGTEPQQATSSGAGPQPLVWRRTTRAPVCSRGVRGSGVASRRQFIQTDDGPERVESSIQSRNIQENKGNVTDR